MRVNTRTLLKRLEQLEKVVPPPRLSVWDALTGHASPSALTGIDRQIWDELHNAHTGSGPPCPIEQAIAAVLVGGRG